MECCDELTVHTQVSIDNECLPTERKLATERKFIFESCLLYLLNEIHNVQLKTSTRGTLLVVSGSCPNGHELHWESQPLLNSMAIGSLLISAGSLFCGLTFTRVANMANVLHYMPLLSERYFHRLQKEYIFLVLHTAYVQQQEALFAFLGGKHLYLSGDGRCYSPGYRPKHCTGRCYSPGYRPKHCTY